MKKSGASKKHDAHFGLNLDRTEWCLDYVNDVPENQLILMLYYEYSRCHKPTVKKTRQLRQLHEKHGYKGWDLAKPYTDLQHSLTFLYPEFPSTPWIEIDWDNHNKNPHQAFALSLIKHELDLRLQPAWQAWDVEWLTIPRNKDRLDDSYGVFKLDITQKDSVIKRQFAKWLSSQTKMLRGQEADVAQKREAELVTKSPKVSDSEWMSPPERFPKRGAGDKKRTYQKAITALGFLRVFIHAKRNVAQANRIVSIPKEISAWHKYEYQAARIMMRVEIMARCGFIYGDLFNATKLNNNKKYESLGLSGSPINLDDFRGEEGREAREYLDRHFTLDELLHE